MNPLGGGHFDVAVRDAVLVVRAFTPPGVAEMGQEAAVCEAARPTGAQVR